jgi:hypothetical protein
MVLLEELAVLKRAGGRDSRQSLVSRKRRTEITEEMKRLAAEKKENSKRRSSSSDV